MVILRNKFMMNKKGMCIAMPQGDKAPMLALTADQFPEIKDWKVGEVYKLEIEVVVKSKAEGQEYSFDVGNKGLIRMSFDIKSIQCDSESEDNSETEND